MKEGKLVGAGKLLRVEQKVPWMDILEGREKKLEERGCGKENFRGWQKN